MVQEARNVNQVRQARQVQRTDQSAYKGTVVETKFKLLIIHCHIWRRRLTNERQSLNLPLRVGSDVLRIKGQRYSLPSVPFPMDSAHLPIGLSYAS